jgi:iron(III) transport system permease protein
MVFRSVSLRGLGALLVALLVAFLVLPVAVVIGAWVQAPQSSYEVLAQMWHTVLPDYVQTTLGLSLLVGIGVTVVGTACAVVVTQFEFPWRRTLEWALLLPLAMPAYVVAYAYTDFFQFSGPAQTGLREMLGVQGRVLPEIRNVWGAAFTFVFTLFPYVYLLVRTVLLERATQMMEAARLLGASLTRRIGRVALPLARPAWVAGAALALMETLADYGVSSYFGIQTFTTGIYKAWLVMDDHAAAAQLASVLLVWVGGVLVWEQRSQSRLRFVSARPERHSLSSLPHRLVGWRALLAVLTCALPVLLGFVLPVLFMLRALTQGDTADLPWARFPDWAWNSLRLAVCTAAMATAVAWWVLAQKRSHPGVWSSGVARVLSLGYAVPGVVIVVGLLVPVGWLQRTWPDAGIGYWLTATVLGVLWAYLVRFVAVAMQSVQTGYTRLPLSYDESARTLGVSGWRLLRTVHLPLLRRPLLASVLLVLVDVMKELPATLVLRPFNTDTLAVMAYQLARDERLAEAALPSLALVFVGLLPVILLSQTLRRQ